MGTYYSSIFRLALQTRTTIVPLCIYGNENIPAKHSLLLHPGTIAVHALKKIPFDAIEGVTAFAVKNRVRKVITERFNQLSTERGAQGAHD